MCMRSENAGELLKRLLGKSVQLHLQLPPPMDRPSLLKSHRRTIIMEELAVPLVLAAVLIVDEDEEAEADVIDLALLVTEFRMFLNF